MTQASYEKQRAVVERIQELLGEIDSLWILNPIYRAWEARMKDLAAVVLQPGSDKPIDDYGGGLSALDYIWDLQGDYSWSSKQEGKPKWKALDYYLGRKVQHIWGTGVLIKINGSYAIRVRLACGTKGCKNKITVFMKPGCHNGAFCYAHDKNGDYQADLRNQWFHCKTCSKRGSKS